MATIDPSTGPVPRAEFFSLVEATFGDAAKKIRKYDPLWGLPPGTKIKWRVECRRTVQYGTAIIEAKTEKAAEAEAEDLTADDVDWDSDPDDFEIVSIKPDTDQ